VAYFGEGASNTGDFHEAHELRRRHKLPIVFICENNQYAYSVPIEKSMAIDDVAVRAEATASTGSPSTATTCSPCSRRCRVPGAAPRRRGPDAHRVQDLSMAWPLGARQGVLPHEEELAMWKSRDPIPTFTTYLEHMTC
jgi:hypothetical protein